jgi:hypothetical protein
LHVNQFRIVQRHIDVIAGVCNAAEPRDISLGIYATLAGDSGNVFRELRKIKQPDLVPM